MKVRLASLAVLVVLGLTLPSTGHVKEFSSEAATFRVVTVTDELKEPWGMTFLPNGDILVTERGGTLRRVSDGKVSEPLSGVPEVRDSGQGGLLDVALHPEFATNRWVYLSYSAGSWDASGTELARGQLNDSGLENVEVIFRASPKSGGGRHFGSRIRFLGDGTLILTLGDRGNRPTGQDPSSHAGSTVRLNDDGTVPDDNPFIGRKGYRPELFTIGNRNVQGLAIHPDTGVPWAHEHGPQGGDEVNILRPGKNYGWPIITYGRNYGSGTKIGEGTAKAGIEQPQHYWDPSIAPSGMDFYTGDKFPDWKGNLFVGALKYQLLARLVLDGEKVVHEERLIAQQFGRIRDVRTGPDGNLYFLATGFDSSLLRIEPAQ